MTIRIIAAMLLLTGCRNDCQKICSSIAEYADEECSQQFSRAEVNECMATYRKRDLSAQKLDDCKEYGDRIEEQSEWLNCDTIDEYFE